MNISPQSITLAPGFAQQFVVTNGVEPYTFAAVNGVIDAEGLYTAPGEVGVDTVTATDANGDTIEAEIVINWLPLQILPTRLAIAKNRTYPFGAKGGSEPYRYARLTGVGSIDEESGVFSSGNQSGVSTIQVIDSRDTRSEIEVKVGHPIELFCDILQQELGLSEGRAYVYNNKINAPKDDGIYIAVGVVSDKPFGSSIRCEEDDEGDFVSKQAINMRALLDVNVISRGPEALYRKEEVILALNSLYSEQQQNLNSFRVFSIPSQFNNISQEDGAAIPYRFAITVAVQYMVTKNKAVPYFDSFETAAEVTTDP